MRQLFYLLKNTALPLLGAFAFIAFSAFGPTRLAAQCDRVGWVAGASTGCGPLIIDLDNGHLLRAVSGADNLPANKTLRLSFTPAALPNGCSGLGMPVAITCISDTLPCVAKFGHAVSQQNAFRVHFSADVYDPAVQFCSWDFGDGSAANGHEVQHTFAQEGYYKVCLTVSDAFGCATTNCRDVFVSQQNPNWCGHEVQVTAVGTKLYGQVTPAITYPGTLKSVKWFNSKTNALLAETPQFTATLPGEGTYAICAQYEVLNPDGQTTCTTTRCQTVTVSAASCANPDLTNPGAICSSVFAPVCGCNGVTYPNECTAMASGLTKWWAGECGAPTSGACGADLDMAVVNGSPSQGYTVRFRNLSAGTYASVQIDFGDGSSLWAGSPADTVVFHHYASGGIYRVNLTVWKNNYCVSSVDELLVTDSYSLQTEHAALGTDYVLPGDANGDKRANVYDLLRLGLGFAKTGAPRPFATTAWAPQFAPNWALATVSGINFKHADCDGSGTVNEFDRNAIEQNYTPIDTIVTDAGEDAPKVWLRFATDSIILDPKNPQPIIISADVMVGNVSKPAINLYGLAFAIAYPEFVKHDPEVLYSTNSFFGFPTDILLLPKDIHPRRQFDLGFARKHGQPVSGFGSIAKINFATDYIIIIDVIERTGATRIPLTMPVRGLRAIDPDGKPIEMTGAVKDTLWLNIQDTSTSSTPGNKPQISAIVYPNPASDAVWVAVPGHQLEHVDVFDALGRHIAAHKPTGIHTTRLDTNRWGKGIFTLRIRTERGVAEKRLAVH
ncbi:MAG: PKD domain-containing protein [Saprospiraceae bacterium]